MRCEYCENTFTLEAVQACQTSEPEQDTFDWSTGSAGWSQEEQEAMRAFHCPSCGGELLTEATTAATFCPYCGSPAILPGRVSESFRPDRIIPFQLRREEAQEAFLRFCTGKRLLPKHFLTSQRLEQDAERAVLRRAVDSLSPRERQIMELRFGLADGIERTQKEAADALGISQSYISRLEKRIIHTLKAQLESE